METSAQIAVPKVKQYPEKALDEAIRIFAEFLTAGNAEKMTEYTAFISARKAEFRTRLTQIVSNSKVVTRKSALNMYQLYCRQVVDALTKQFDECADPTEKASIGLQLTNAKNNKTNATKDWAEHKKNPAILAHYQKLADAVNPPSDKKSRGHALPTVSNLVTRHVIPYLVNHEEVPCPLIRDCLATSGQNVKEHKELIVAANFVWGKLKDNISTHCRNVMLSFPEPEWVQNVISLNIMRYPYSRAAEINKVLQHMQLPLAQIIHMLDMSELKAIASSLKISTSKKNSSDLRREICIHQKISIPVETPVSNEGDNTQEENDNGEEDDNEDGEDEDIGSPSSNGHMALSTGSTGAVFGVAPVAHGGGQIGSFNMNNLATAATSLNNVSDDYTASTTGQIGTLSASTASTKKKIGTVAELTKLATDNKISVPKGMKKEAIMQLLHASGVSI